MHVYIFLFICYISHKDWVFTACSNQLWCGFEALSSSLQCKKKNVFIAIYIFFLFFFSFSPKNFWINIINIFTIWLWYCCYDTEFKGLLWGPCFAEKMICTITILRVYVQHELSTLMVVITSSVGLFQNFYIPYNQTNFLFFLSSLS